MDEASESLDSGRHEERRGVRNRSIRRAISMSLASKASTAVLQFVSLPVAARTMGREEFGIYATVSMAVLLVLVLQMGIGPALSRGISVASVHEDRDKEGVLYWNGVWLVIFLVSVGLIAGSLLISLAPVSALFGEKYAPWEVEVKSGVWTGLVLIAGLFLVSHTDRVREGYMEADTVNAWGAGGNLAGALIVLCGVHAFPTIPFLLIAVYGPNIIARVLNTFFLWRKRPYLLLRKNAQFDGEVMRELVGDGISFSATTFLVYLVEFGLCTLLVGRFRGPGDVAIFQVLMSLTTAFEGLLSMVGTPVWAALVDAKKQCDRDWMMATIRKYYRYLFVLTAGAAGGAVSLGPLVIPLWYGEEFAVGRAVLAGHAFFLAALGWREVNRFVTVGLDLLPVTVGPILGGVALSLVLGVAGLHFAGLWGLFAGLGLGVVFVPGWVLPVQIRGQVRASEGVAEQEELVAVRA